jgi:hypothetical protein
MQSKALGVMSVLAIAMVLTVPAMYAQSRLIANVPFDFSLGQKTMSAGLYEVKPINNEVESFRNMQTGISQIVMKSQNVLSDRQQGARLVFNKYGEHYFLAEIWDGSGNPGIQFARSKHEKELRLAQDRDAEGPEVVVVAMK